MRVIVDEDLPKAVTDLLASRGYDGLHVLHMGLGGQPDNTIFRFAQDEQALILTADLDFGNVQVYPPGTHFGIIVLRFPDYFRREQILRLVSSFLDSTPLEPLIGALVVVEPGGYRVRRA